jgi:hypothetical protein
VGHIYVVASGFGKRVIPKTAPYRFAVGDAGSLRVGLGEGAPAIVGSAQSVAQAHAAAAAVADVVEGPEWAAWWLETHAYRVPLPEGWTAHASGEVSPSVFDLVGPGESMLFVQMPRVVPPVEQMVAKGQRLVERGEMSAGEWIRVQYTHAGVSYLQRHVRMRIGEWDAMVTLQCREEVFATVGTVQLRVVEEILPGG